MVVKDWVEDVAVKICQKSRENHDEQLSTLEESWVKEIIEAHCPFEKNVLYEPVDEISTKLDKLINICNRIQNDI